MLRTILVLAVLLGACAPKLTGGPSGGVVQPAYADEAFTMAQEHCAQFGKNAQISGFERIGSISTFNCVDR